MLVLCLGLGIIIRLFLISVKFSAVGMCFCLGFFIYIWGFIVKGIVYSGVRRYCFYKEVSLLFRNTESD